MTGPRPTLADIARATGKSIATVSGVLNGKPAFAQATREQVLRVARDLEYIPNGNAQALRQPGAAPSSSLVLAVYIAHLGQAVPGSQESHRYFDRFHDLLRHALPRGVCFIPHWYDDVAAPYTCPPLDAGLVDAAILGTARPQVLDAVRGRASIVLLDVPFSLETARLPMVNADIRYGMSLLQQHLAELGHRRLGVFGIEPVGHHNYHASRYARFLEALALGELTVDDAFAQPWRLTAANHETVVADLLERIVKAVRAQRISALVCLDDSYVTDLIPRLAAAGVRVPDDLSLTGFNQLPGASETLAITSVRYNWSAMYDAALDTLLALLAGRQQKLTEILVYPEFASGRTTAPVTKGAPS